jgi:hypothetical protein
MSQRTARGTSDTALWRRYAEASGLQTMTGLREYLAYGTQRGIVQPPTWGCCYLCEGRSLSRAFGKSVEGTGSK